MTLKDVIGSHLLFEDEPLTPNIDTYVMLCQFEFLERELRNENPQTFDFSDFFFPRPIREGKY